MRPNTLGVIGLGAIGGSVAWQAARSGVPRVLAYTRAPRDGVAALKVGAITELAQSVSHVVRRADLVVLATPPAATLALLRRHRDEFAGGAALVTDVTSVKAPVIHLARALGLEHRFAGSHPFAGTHGQGFGAARVALLRGAVVYVSPVADDDTPGREVADFWVDVFDAQCVVVDAAVHDELLAWTSHLPQAIASALAGAIAEWGPRGVTYGTGARDTTRLAASSVEMWRDVLLMNREPVLAALDRFDEATGALRRALADGDPEGLVRWLERGATWRRGIDA